jgi:2Fe-2S ferredoxin
MATVTLESADGKKTTTVVTREPMALADLIDDSEAPIPFSCRSASCATCHIEVLEGEDAFFPPEDEELEVLDAIQTPPPRFRLACCARLREFDGRVHVRAQNE